MFLRNTMPRGSNVWKSYSNVKVKVKVTQSLTIMPFKTGIMSERFKSSSEGSVSAMQFTRVFNEYTEQWYISFINDRTFMQLVKMSIHSLPYYTT